MQELERLKASGTAATDADYTNIRKELCATASAVDVTTVERFMFDKDPYKCGGDVLSFYRDKDFQMIEPEAGSLEVDRQDKASTLALKQTEASAEQALTWEQEFPIQAKYGDRLNTFLIRVLMAEQQSGRNGKGIIAYSNAGVHYEKVVIFNKGQVDEFKVKMFFPNLKVTEWPNVYMGDITSESTVNLNVNIENMPVVTFEGATPIWFGIPSDLTAPTITYDTIDLTATGDLTISGLMFTDEDMIANDELVYIDVFDKVTGLLILEDTTDGSVEADYTTTLPTENTSVIVRISYKVGNMNYITDTVEVNAGVARTFKASSLEAPEEENINK